MNRLVCVDTVFLHPVSWLRRRSFLLCALRWMIGVADGEVVPHSSVSLPVVSVTLGPDGKTVRRHIALGVIREQRAQVRTIAAGGDTAQIEGVTVGEPQSTARMIEPEVRIETATGGRVVDPSRLERSRLAE